jgi:2Fe-2S ferredoxin
MIEVVLDPQSNSRLSCQIMATDALDGLVPHLPDAQY